MADAETKLAVAKEITEVVYSNIRVGVITPQEAAEIVEALARIFRRTNDLFKQAGDGDFIAEGMPPIDPKDWS